MRCTNSGSEYDAEDIQWTCQASLPPEFKLGSTEVLCEGYDNPDDPYILKGSCGVEYRLILTDEGERRYASRSQNQRAKKVDSAKELHEPSSSFMDKFWTFIFWSVFASTCTNPQDIVRVVY